MINYPKVSIVTPSYNQGQFLEETILSVLNQDYPNIEYIIIDGGSTDGSIEIIRKYEDRIAYWISEPDNGQAQAINKGFQKATGEIYAYLNSDDIYTDRAISTIVRYFLKKNNVAMVYGDCDFINEQGRLLHHLRLHRFEFKKLLRGNFIPQPTVFFKKEVINEVGLFDVALRYAMDYDYWLKIASKFRVHYLPRTLAQFRLHPDSKTVSQAEHFWLEMFNILDSFLKNKSLPRQFLDIIYSHMLWLIVLGQNRQIEKNMEFFQNLYGKKWFSDDEAQTLRLFFEGHALTTSEITDVRSYLYKLYLTFDKQYIKKDKALKRSALSWIDKQMIQTANYLFDLGKENDSKRYFWMIVRTNPQILKEPLVFWLAIKYFITYDLCIRFKKMYYNWSSS